MGKNSIDVNPDNMVAFITDQVEMAKGRRRVEKKDVKGDSRSAPFVGERDPKRQKSSSSSDKRGLKQ